MKNKTKSKAAVTKANKKKVGTKPVVLVMNIRQIDPKKLVHEGAVHVVLLVNNTSGQILTFNTTEELNSWLFEFDVENYGKDPVDTGTWIDHIFLDVQGGFFDPDELEPYAPNFSDLE